LVNKPCCLTEDHSVNGRLSSLMGKLPRVFDDPAIRYTICGISACLLLIGAHSGSGAAASFKGEPQRAPSLVQQQISEKDLAGLLAPGPLRGSSDSPASFQWLFLDDSEAGVPAGTEFRTVLAALDYKGRPAKSGGVRVNVSCSGNGQLASIANWTGSMMILNIKDSRAEQIAVEVQVESAQGSSLPLVYRSTVRFTAAAFRSYKLAVQPYAFTSLVAKQPGYTGNTSAKLPTLIVHQVVLMTIDQLGNPMDADIGSDCGNLILRSSSRSLEMLSSGGRFAMSRGQAVVLLRSRAGGAVDVWLDALAGGLPLEPASLRLEFDHATSEAAEAGGNYTGVETKYEVLAFDVKEAFLHAWNGYKRYAWGADEIKPISLEGKDTFGNIGMTIIDSLTTLWLMGLKKEFDQGTAFVENELDFDQADREISVFEVIIRALGGLLGAYSLSSRPIFLDRAVELADRLLPAMNTSSGLPLPRWNLARGLGKGTYDSSKEPTILAEAGSFQLEFRFLSAITGDLRYSRVADACTLAIRSAGAGLVPVHLSPPDRSRVKFMKDRIAMGALADSYYEYLLKQWLQAPADTPARDAWLAVMDELPTLVHPDPRLDTGGKRLQLIENDENGGRIWKMDHLSCFVPGMIALGIQSMPPESLMGGRSETWLRMAEGL
ncbi:unnamed protein product, partial [Effrenium voratum]